MNNTTPAIERTSFSCPHCGAYAQQTTSQLYREDSSKGFGGNNFLPLKRSEMWGEDFEYYDEEVLREQWGNEDNFWNVTICLVCEKPAFWEGKKLIYPIHQQSSFPKATADMPSDVAELYEEASKVFPISRRASAALMRAATEKLVKDLTQDSDLKSGTRLDDRIAYLSTQTTPVLTKGLALIRVIGNETLHSDSANQNAVALYLNEDETGVPQLLAATLNGLVNELITQPRQMDNAYEQLSQGTRNTIEQKQKRYRGEGEKPSSPS